MKMRYEPWPNKKATPEQKLFSFQPDVRRSRSANRQTDNRTSVRSAPKAKDPRFAEFDAITD
jgi:hypothetical protein